MWSCSCISRQLLPERRLMRIRKTLSYRGRGLKAAVIGLDGRASPVKAQVVL